MSAPLSQSPMSVERIKQYPGQQQVTRAVKVRVPGKHFPALTPTEQKEQYEGSAVEFTERHKFPAFLRGWGAAHTGPGVLLMRIVRLHYNWKYDFIRPSIKAVCARYMEKFHAAPCAAASDEPSASAAATAPDAAPPTPTAAPTPEA